ncbi:MAG: hypothetical protein ACI9OJ_000688 [Myxococcota bacterium]|jgi:hypothetical protein
MVPESSVPEGVLEVFLMGGLNPWDTFYAVPDHGRPEAGGPYAGQQWWTWQEGEDSVPDVFARCGGEGYDLLAPIGLDAAGKQVNLGPWVYPLRDRPDILSRMRIHVVAHDNEPHEAAAPLMLGGQPRGTPRMCSTGAHVQRFWQEREPLRTAPFSYVLYPGSHFVAGFNVESAFAVGTHPGRVQPLAVQIAPDNPLSAQLSRSRLGGRHTQMDAAIEHYLNRYGAAYANGPAARELEQYRFARAAMQNAGELQSLLTADALAMASGASCGFDDGLDVTGTGLRLGAHLLTSDAHRARYVHVVDSGLYEAQDGGYDTHRHHVRDTSRNTVHLCRKLAAIINEPGENDPRKVDLDRHQILLTTEMGRTPFPELGNIRGLNHWPYGFVVMSIGGPGSQNRAQVSGAIGEDGRATIGTSPAEFRAAMLLSQGIWPFSPESFAVSDVRGATTELEAALILRERVLGFPA